MFFDARCTRCELHLGATNVKVRSKGAEDPVVLFVGEAPGRTEDKEGSVFIGKAGQEFDKFLEQAGLDKDLCRWTNVVRCIPWNEDRSSFRAPKDDEIEACLPHLEGEILTTSPVFVVPLGNTALHALVPKAPGITKARKRRYFIELPSLKYRYKKAVLWAKANHLAGDKDAPLAPPLIPSDKAMRQYLAATEAQGGPVIDTRLVTVYPTFHPSAAARGNQAASLGIVEDLGYIRTQLTGDRGIPFADYEYCDTLEDIRDHFEYIKALYHTGKLEAICVDLETTGLSPYLTENPRVVLFSVAYGEGKAFSIPFDHHESPFVNDMLAKRAIVAMLQELLEEVPVVNHNLKFDLHWLALMGLEVWKFKVLGDSMLSSWTIWNDTIQDHSLETLATSHVGMISHKQEMDQAKRDAFLALLDQGIERDPTMDDIDIDIVHKYCCADTDSALRLFIKFEDILRAEELLEPHQRVCIPSILPTTEMEINGVRCNGKLLAEVKAEFEQQFKDYYAQLDTWGLTEQLLQVLNEKAYEKAELKGKKPKSVKSFKLTAPATKAALVFDVMGFDVVKEGKLAPSTDKGVISDLMEECTRHIGEEDDVDGSWAHKLEVLDLVRKFSTAHTIYSRYVKPIPQFIDRNGIVHPNFGIRTTRTGRFNCQKPSFHQMPWKSKVKQCFIPIHENGLIFSADYSQMELRVLASVTGDLDMIAAFDSGEDIHRLISSMVLGKPQSEVLDAERRRMKTVVFGLVYGRSAKSIAAQEHISAKAAQDLIDKFFARFPKVKEWIKAMQKFAKKHGYVLSPFGFRRLLEAFLSDVERNNRAINTPIQGGASDVGVRGFTNVWKLMRRVPRIKSTMFAQVHDSILFSVAPHELYTMGVLCKKGMVEMPMRELSWLRCMLRADFEFGASWGEMVEAKWLDNRRIQIVKAKPAYYEKIKNIFMSWSSPPLLIEETAEQTLEDGSKLVLPGASVLTREAVKEETWNSVWEFEDLLKAA